MIDDVLTDAGRRMDKSVEAAKHEFTTHPHGPGLGGAPRPPPGEHLRHQDAA